MNGRRAWMLCALLIASAPAWSWKCDNDSDDPSTCQHSVPEPTTLALLALGSGALWLVRRRRVE